MSESGFAYVLLEWNKQLLDYEFIIVVMSVHQDGDDDNDDAW